MAKVFISYRRSEPDVAVAQALHEALRQAGHDVFIDVSIPVGVAWAERIEQELRGTDFLIPLLSERSVRSEMVAGEIETAHRLKKRILPVRLAYREPFPYPLSAWLNPINWAFWEGPSGTDALARELTRAIAENGAVQRVDLPPAPASAPVSFSSSPTLPPPLPVAPVQMEEGTMDVESRFYVKRPSDDVAHGALFPKQAGKGQTLNIKGGRQMGKSSLLIRLISAAVETDKKVAFVDLQEFDSATIEDADLFYRNFCVTIGNQLDLENRVDALWDPGLGNVQRCSAYMGDYVLKTLGAPLVLAMDEVDRLFDAPFRSDFFGMLRNWHNRRALPIKPIWKKLDLVLVTSTEPNLLIENLNQSPFNVGTQLELLDFSVDEVGQLNRMHGQPFSEKELGELVTLIGGHPFLMRRALHRVADQRMTARELLDHTDLDGGPFGDHLRHLLLLIIRNDGLIKGLREVLKQRTCSDATVLHSLRSAGMVRPDGDRVIPRCELYTRYFRKHLLG